MEVDVQAFEREINSHALAKVRAAVDRLRGRPCAVGHGKVEDGQPQPGVQVRRSGDHVQFELTTVSGDSYTRETHWLSAECVSGFASALLQVLGS
jgi:hypothetical protein